MESEQRGTKITKKILMMMLSLLMVLSMAALTGCGSNDSADAGESEANDDVVAEEEAAEEPAAPDLESLDEIQGHYE